MKKLIRTFSLAVLTLVGAQAQANTVLAVSVPNKLANHCDLLERGDYIIFGFDGVGFSSDPKAPWEGWIYGTASGGIPVACYGTVAISGGRRGFRATLKAQTLEIGDTCEFTNVTFRDYLIAVD
jgi:hypothetical protein